VPVQVPLQPSEEVVPQASVGEQLGVQATVQVPPEQLWPAGHWVPATLQVLPPQLSAVSVVPQATLEAAGQVGAQTVMQAPPEQTSPAGHWVPATLQVLVPQVSSVSVVPQATVEAAGQLGTQQLPLVQDCEVGGAGPLQVVEAGQSGLFAPLGEQVTVWVCVPGPQAGEQALHPLAVHRPVPQPMQSTQGCVEDGAAPAQTTEAAHWGSEGLPGVQVTGRDSEPPPQLVEHELHEPALHAAGAQPVQTRQFW
jgi:hypothetical protein